MINNKRRHGDLPGQNMRKILRIVHSFKKEVEEPELREKIETELHISDKGVISNHLRNLEGSSLISCNIPLSERGKSGKVNKWKSCVYSHVNSDFEKCGVPALTETEEELVDVFIKYSGNFVLILTTENLCKLIKNIKSLKKLEKRDHDFERVINSVRSKHSIPTSVNDTPNISAIGHILITFDVIKGDLNINESNFLKEYEAVQAKFVGLGDASRIVEDVVATNRLKESTDKLKEIEFESY